MTPRGSNQRTDSRLNRRRPLSWPRSPHNEIAVPSVAASDSSWEESDHYQTAGQGEVPFDDWWEVENNTEAVGKVMPTEATSAETGPSAPNILDAAQMTQCLHDSPNPGTQLSEFEIAQGILTTKDEIDDLEEPPTEVDIAGLSSSYDEDWGALREVEEDLIRASARRCSNEASRSLRSPVD